MKNTIKISAFVLVMAGTSVLTDNAFCGEDVSASKDIVDNAVKSNDPATLVAAGKAADLKDTLHIKANARQTEIAPAANGVMMHYSFEGESLIDDCAYEYENSPHAGTTAKAGGSESACDRSRVSKDSAIHSSEGVLVGP